MRRVSRAEIVPIWKAAELLLKPEEETQRKVFESLMPYIYSLRDKGCSWNQITDLVIKSGLNLQPSTVRSYYSEMLASRQDVCQARMTDQILLMAEVKKSQEDGEQSALKKKLAEILKKNTEISPLISSKIDSIFGDGPLQVQSEVPVASNARVADGNQGEKIFEGLRPSIPSFIPSSPPKIPLPLKIADMAIPSEFGLLNTNPEHKRALKKGFFADLNAPEIPNLQSMLKEIPVVTTVLRCAPLTDDVPPLAVRAGVDPVCYLPGQLEHPAVTGLMLSLEERVFSAALEFICSDGTNRLETLDEKRFRIKWKNPIALSHSSTDGDFTTMDHSIFGKHGDV